MHVLSTVVKTFIVVAAGTVAGTAGHVAGQCGTPDSSLGARIDASYAPAPSTGAWAEMRNWGDADSDPDGVMGDGKIAFYTSGPKQGLAYPTATVDGDWYVFALRGPGENPYPERPGQKHQPIIIADPSVLRMTWQGETWYFITGTSGAPDTRTRLTGDLVVDSNQDELALLGTQLANFVIYRTKDFYHFEPHMLAFNEFTQGQPAGPRRSNTVLHVAGDRKFIGLQSPCLYLDPAYPDDIFLTFTAVEYEAGETAPDFATDELAWRQSIFNNTSVFLTKMSLTEFMGWRCENWYTFQGPRFTYGPAWYYYYYSGLYRADGGSLVGHAVPSSGPPQHYDGSTGPLEPRLTTDPIGDHQDPPWAGRGWGHKAWSTSHTWMAEGSYFFLDTKLGAVPDRWLIYDWNDAKGASGNTPGDLNPKFTNDNWGNAIAAHPLASGDEPFIRPFVFDHNYTTMFIANNRSNYNPVSPCLTYCVKNGRANDNGLNWWWGGVGESSCAFYLASTDCYYLLLSRNGASTAAYQVVYRRTSPGQPFTALNIGSSTDFTKPESVLLRGLYYNWYRDPVPPPPPAEPPPPPASYGSPTYFEMVDAEGGTIPYIAFHARLEGSQRRTIFFKELTLSGNDLIQLWEGRDSPPSKQASIDYYRIPWCRPEPCPADLNGDGSVDFGDYTEFLNFYDAGCLRVDFTRDGLVDFTDYLFFLDHYNSGC